MQNNALIEKVANDLLAAGEYLKQHTNKPKEKNYIQSYVDFFPDEIEQIHSAAFRELFESCGNATVLRRYFYYTGKGVRYEYELRFIRFGYRIIARSDNLAELKQEFIKAVNASITV